MKLTDITAAALRDNPNLELGIETPEGEVTVVFRNVILISEDERRTFADLEKEREKIMRAKNADTMPRKLANVAKHMVAQVVQDKSHIELLEAEFAKDEALRDAHWVAVAKAYNQETQVGEA